MCIALNIYWFEKKFTYSLGFKYLGTPSCFFGLLLLSKKDKHFSKEIHLIIKSCPTISRKYLIPLTKLTK